MTVHVVTAVHNRYDITKLFVQNLNKQTWKNIHLVLVDDGSTDGTDKMVKESFSNLTILYGDGNLWWGGALHKAYMYLTSLDIDKEDVIFLINDDSKIGERYIEDAVSILNKNPDALLTGCAYGIKTGNYLDGPVSYDLSNGAVKLLEAGSEGNCTSTRALCLKYHVFKELGGFHPILLPHYASDYEYTIRAYKKGYKIISDKNLNYQFSEDTTGDNSHKALTLKKIFSKRSKLNPFYKLIFILMIAPIYRIPSYIIYQVKHFNKHDRDNGKSI